MANPSNNKARKNSGSLIRQVTLILALATFCWGMIQGTDIGTSIFRTIVVYLVGSILAYWVGDMMFKTKKWAELEELKRLQAAKEEGDANRDQQKDVQAGGTGE